VASLIQSTLPEATSDILASSSRMTARQYARAHAQQINMKHEIKRLKIIEQEKTFNHDYQAALNAENSDSAPIGDLQLLAYKKVRPDNRLFDTPEDIANTFKGIVSPPNLMVRAAIAEQASYAPLFKDMNQIASSGPHGKLLERGIKQNHPTTAHLYRIRLEPITTPKIIELEAKHKRIRESLR
jgi:hypothetical protein